MTFSLFDGLSVFLVLRHSTSKQEVGGGPKAWNLPDFHQLNLPQGVEEIVKLLCFLSDRTGTLIVPDHLDSMWVTS